MRPEYAHPGAAVRLLTMATQFAWRQFTVQNGHFSVTLAGRSELPNVDQLFHSGGFSTSSDPVVDEQDAFPRLQLRTPEAQIEVSITVIGRRRRFPPRVAVRARGRIFTDFGVAPPSGHVCAVVRIGPVTNPTK